MQEFERPFLAAMKAKGWNVGVNLLVERAHAEGNAERLPGLARELVQKHVDLIVSGGAQTTIAAARATSSIPIVFSGPLWPVEQGLIDSFRRPGGNVTGHAFYTGVEYSAKRLQFLREVAPTATRLSWVWPEFLFSAETMSGGRVDMIPVFDAAAKRLGFDTRFHLIGRGKDIDAVLAEMEVWKPQALTVGADPTHRLVKFALRHRIPNAFATREDVEAGALMCFGPAETPASWAIRTAEYVDRIFRGAQPADIPVELPSRYELVISLKSSKALGLSVPRSLLARADEIIQ